MQLVRSKLLRRVLEVLAAMIVAIVVVEVTASVALHYVVGAPEPPEELRGVALFSSRAPERVTDPYLLFRVKPNLETEHVRTNNLGLRNGPITQEPGPDTVRVLLLGGSVAWGYSALSNEGTLSSLLAAQLTEKRDQYETLRGKTIEVLNAGVPGYVTWQDVLSYVVYHRHLRPDFVILLGGPNDIAAAITSGHAAWPMRFAPSPYPPPRKELSGEISSWLRARLARLKINRLRVALNPRPLSTIDPLPPEEVARTYRSGIELVADVARNEGARVLVVFQPQSIIPGSKIRTPFEAAMVERYGNKLPGRNAFIEECTGVLRATLEELKTARPDLMVFDATMLYEKEARPIYTDQSHLTPLGQQLLAEAIGAELLAGID